MNPDTQKARKSRFSVGNYGILLISLTFLITMGKAIWASGNPTNPVKRNSAEQRGMEYLQATYPGLYEQVQTHNSGVVYQEQDGTWTVRYFSREDNSDMFSPMTDLYFNLHFDEDFNLITDGYREYYLKGGSVYARYSSEFYHDFYGVIREKNGDKKLLLKGAYADKINDYDFENVSFIEAGDGYKYTGDYIDPAAEHDAKELYARYGCVYLKFFMESGDFADYRELVKDVNDIMRANNMPYNTMHIYMYFHNSETVFCEGTFKAKDMATDIDSTIDRNTFVHTRREREEMKANGEEIPNVEVGSFGELLSEASKEFSSK